MSLRRREHVISGAVRLLRVIPHHREEEPQTISAAEAQLVGTAPCRRCGTNRIDSQTCGFVFEDLDQVCTCCPPRPPPGADSATAARRWPAESFRGLPFACVRTAVHVQDLSCYLTGVRRIKNRVHGVSHRGHSSHRLPRILRTSIPGPMEALPGVGHVTVNLLSRPILQDEC